MNGNEMFRQKSAKQTNVQTQARQQNRQRIESGGRRWLPKQQRGVSAATATTPKTTSELNLDSLSLFILSEKSQTEYVREFQNSKKKL